MHCSECGEEVADGSLYCQACGAELNPPDRREEASTSREGSVSDGITEKEKTGESSDSSGFKQVVYWGGRLGQVALVGVACILLLGALIGNMSILAFGVIGIFALVLFGLVAVLEFLLIRPFGS